MSEPIRCPWAKPGLYAKYHDREWGVPLHDDRALFEMLILEGAQAGLSWETILNKREAYRAAFDNFDAAKIARYDARRRARLMNNAGIVRNRLKINAAIENAKAYLKVREEFGGGERGNGENGPGGFDRYIWSFVGGEPIVNRRQSLKEVPARTEISDAMSKDLKRRGFKFVGSTICYAYMQAVGMVNDHLVTCAWHGGAKSASVLGSYLESYGPRKGCDYLGRCIVWPPSNGTSRQLSNTEYLATFHAINYRTHNNS